jgi:hypothetical protein
MARDWSTLLDVVSGAKLAEEDDGPARRAQLAARALPITAGLAAVYGVAVGSMDVSSAAANAWKVPMVVLLSAAFAMPAALLTWKLVGSKQRASDLVLGQAAGVLAAALVLAVLAPLVALYYHTTAWLGAVLAMGTATLALFAGVGIGLRAVWRRRPEGFGGGAISLAPVMVLVTVQLASMAQLVAIASPILPEVTVFDGGLEGLVSR